MCGIVGAISQQQVTDLLVSGLQHLEYRGYDSAGVAVIDNKTKDLVRVRTVGKVQELKNLLASSYPDLDAHVGIAHTRWATHGVPSELNAHPHISDGIVLVHNGIIENHEELRNFLIAQGYKFESETDTEVISHLVNFLLHSQDREQEAFGAQALDKLRENFVEALHQPEVDLLTAVKMAVCILTGAYGMVVLDKRTPEQLIAARSGSPLVIGLGEDGNYLASDQLALLEKTRKFIYLEEGDVARITLDHVDIYDAQFNLVERQAVISNLKHDATSKGDFETFMLKEIYDQPKAISDSLEGRLINDNIIYESIGKNAKEILAQVQHVQIVACGTSYHSGMVAKYWIEEYAGISCDVEIASEYRYRRTITRPNSLLVTISQSGETADTLAALRKAKASGFLATMTICNVPSSSMVRESDLVYLTRCGVEIGVASTKAFTNQLVLLILLTMALGGVNGNIDASLNKELAAGLYSLPRIMENYLHDVNQISELKDTFKDFTNLIFIGRDMMYPIAKEGDLKLKEISYIHSEAFAGGELKHGPLALIDEHMPVVALAPSNILNDKMRSNIEEVSARKGKLFIFTDAQAGYKEKENVKVIELPLVERAVAPIFYALPMQLLAYFTTQARGYDADKPRNLAKSVTVE